MSDPNASASAIEYALEPLKNVISMTELDCIDPGTGETAASFYNELPLRPRMKQAIEFLHNLIPYYSFSLNRGLPLIIVFLFSEHPLQCPA